MQRTNILILKSQIIVKQNSKSIIESVREEKETSPTDISQSVHEELEKSLAQDVETV